MSAYIVPAYTIHRIVTYITKKDVQLSTPFGCKTPDEIGQALWALNHRAVNQRYNERTRTPAYNFTEVPESKVQVLKAMQNLSYQCSEGDCPNRKLYKDLQQVIGSLACDIVSDSKEWDKAEWG